MQGDFSRSLKHGKFPGDRDQRADDGLDIGAASIRPTTGSCAKMSTPISRTAPTWWSTGTGHRSRQIRRPTGRAFCRTIWSRIAPTPRCRRTAHELEKIGPHLVGLKIHNDVAILWSRDSANAIGFMPFTSFRTAVELRRPNGRLRIAGAADASLALRPECRRGFCVSRDAGFLRIQTADRAGALHLRRCAAAAHLGLREKWRPRGDDVQERIRE